MTKKAGISQIMSMFVLLAFTACGQNPELDDSSSLSSGVTDSWYSDYGTAFVAAKSRKQPLLIYFQNQIPTSASQEFENNTLTSPEIQTLLNGMVLLKLTKDVQIGQPGNSRRLLDFFPDMAATAGVLLVDLASNPGTPSFGYTLSELPFLDWSKVNSAQKPIYAQMGQQYKPWLKEQFAGFLQLTGTGYSDRARNFASRFSGNTISPNGLNPNNNQFGGQPNNLSQSGFSQVVQDMLAENNRLRATEGLEPQTLDPKLVAAAQGHSENMARQIDMSHDLDGKGVTERARAAGFSFRTIAENIAAGQTSVSQVFNSWYNSPGHYRNMMSSNRLVGFGLARDTYGVTYWTTVYGSK